MTKQESEHVIASLRSRIELMKQRIADSESYGTRMEQALQVANSDRRNMIDALQSNQIFHTPVALRRRGGQWDEYELDAIKRTREVLSKHGGHLI